MLFAYVVLGILIDVFVYQIFISYHAQSYIESSLVFLSGVFITGLGSRKGLNCGIFKFPIEKFCQIAQSLTSISFSIYRYGVDFLCIIASLILSLVFHLEFFVREGTFISMILISSLVSKYKK